VFVTVIATVNATPAATGAGAVTVTIPVGEVTLVLAAAGDAAATAPSAAVAMAAGARMAAARRGFRNCTGCSFIWRFQGGRNGNQAGGPRESSP
jgi:hypothetical protein